MLVVSLRLLQIRDTEIVVQGRYYCMMISVFLFIQLEIARLCTSSRSEFRNQVQLDLFIADVNYRAFCHFFHIRHAIVIS